MIVTEAWLRSNMNGGVGIKAKQAAALGLPPSPPKGWLKRIVGTEITEAQARAFEANKGKPKDKPDIDDGSFCDARAVLVYFRSVGIEEFMASPIAAHGYKNAPLTKCSVCAKKIKLGQKPKEEDGIHYVGVCKECGITVFKYSGKLLNECLYRYKLSFDDMRKNTVFNKYAGKSVLKAF